MENIKECLNCRQKDIDKMWPLDKILEEVDSPYNGRIKVVRTLEGVRILVGGVSQSGYLLKKIWKVALAQVKKDKSRLKKVLILGLGGGSVTEVVDQLWTRPAKVAIDIDPIMVSLGKKYLELGRTENLKIEIADAKRWVVDKRNYGKFDLVIVDLYKATVIPEEFRKERFVGAVRKLLAPSGVAAFNHFYAEQDRENAKGFLRNLRKVFSAIKTVTPEANIIFICYT